MGQRRVVFPDGAHEVEVYGRDALRAGHRIAGPALVEEAVSVTVVNPGQVLSVDPFGHLIIDSSKG
jgi:N-methylhydantoinase A